MLFLAGLGCSAPSVELTGGELTEPPADPCPAGECLIDPPEDEVRQGWATVAIDPTGAAWMSYAVSDGPAVTGLFVTRSAAAGEPWSTPVQVPVAEPPNVGNTEKPALAVDGDRIALAYTGKGDTLRHAEANSLYVQIGTIGADGVPTFDAAIHVDHMMGDEMVLEQARVAFAPDGEIWVLWKRQRYGEEDWATWARESDGFTPVQLSDDLSHRHDCSPPDFRFGFSGEPLIGLRSNIDGWLQTMAVVGDRVTATASEVAQVSDDKWPYNDEVCPEDGPRLIELADGTLFAAWMAPSDIAWRLFSAWSTDGGATWTAPAFDHEGVDLGEKWVALAPRADGPFYTAVEGLDSTTRLLTRDAPGAPYTEELLLDGVGFPLFDVELASQGDRSVAIGMGDDRVLWLRDL
ncbi:MAG: sialidase family protein [Myxococcota bacterium]